MKKIGELEGKPIVTDEYAPSRGDVIWKDPSDEKFKEAIDGEWADSPKIPSGGGSDEFPYEYYCPDDFSVVINPEDWIIDEETYANKQIPTQVKIPKGYILRVGTCNNTGYSTLEGNFVTYVEAIGDDIEVVLNLLANEIYIRAYGEIDPSEVAPVTLNFNDLIFLGDKKEQ